MKATDDHRVWMRLSEKLIIEYGKKFLRFIQFLKILLFLGLFFSKPPVCYLLFDIPISFLILQSICFFLGKDRLIVPAGSFGKVFESSGKLNINSAVIYWHK